MSDHIEAIIAGLENCCSECADQAEHIAYAINEHAEVIITTQAADAAHDAAVAAKALREAADGFSDPDDPCLDTEPLDAVAHWLRAMADHAEKHGGGSDV